MDSEGQLLAGEKRALRRGAWQILTGSGSRMFARVLLITFVARVYGIDDFGRLGEAVAMLELLAAFATFGLTKTLLGNLGAMTPPGTSPVIDPGKHIFDALALVTAVSAVIMAVLWAVWPYVLPSSLSGSQFLMLGIPLIALTEVATTATRHFRTVLWDTLVKAVVKPWSFLLLGILSYFAVRGFTMPSGHIITSEQALLIAYVGSLLLSAIIALLAMGKSYSQQSPRLLRVPTFAGVFGLARSSWPIALNETGVFAFRRADILLLAAVASPTATGIYYLAQQIGTVAGKVRHLYEPMLAPIIAQSRSLETIGEHLRRLTLFIFAIQMAVISVFVIFGGSVLELLGTGFAAGITVVIVILIGELMEGSFGLAELVMVYRDPALPPRQVVFTLALEILLVWYLAASYGALGAAIGFAASMTALAAMRIFMVRRLYGLRILGLKHLAILSAAAAIWLVASPFLPVFANLGISGF
ncbi:lipopolysaccharide biosynthesis protein [Allopontixanthobacter sp.]|uniref:lipopolysaccharide biosynthesis protein n=1 Tax=Allopontixanthobacter sp. TaxID=2906452 RepID=UPI002ABB11C9|nr:polysaccharide biosynthesis C-terminal domain-containing protein [Allopontixanthobacter sp.]MDZ4307060.1 polysaccharide biosynthesis C-terminal domain-containing protein [Allopontixanthobacter sp.]